MSILDKLLHKNKTAETPPDADKIEESPVPSPSAPSTEPEEEKPENPPRVSYSPQSLLQELYNHESNYPQDLQLIRNFLPAVQIKAKIHAQAYENYENWKHTAEMMRIRQENGDAEAEIPPAPDSLNASAHIVVSQDKMNAYIYLLPPVGEGADITPEIINTALESAGVTAGIDQEILGQLSAQKVYYSIFPIARGTAPVNGEDGRIADHYARLQEIHLQEDERGNVDHRNLNLFQNVKAGEIICDIIPPGEGTDGINVLGAPVTAQKGREAVIPKGKGTAVTKDGAALIALIDGNITFINNLFRVESQLTISHDVNSSVGNLDFAGDILITGDVCSGFTVKAGGNITIFGMVESATVTAGENIDIKKGMNGGGAGLLKAGGNVTSRFLEHANVWAKGDIISETIVNSQITCGGSVFVNRGRGAIIGGTVCAALSVEARKIGTSSNTENIIKIGSSILQEENADYLTAELATARKTLDMITKNYKYLTGLSSIPASKQEIFKSLSEQKKLYETHVKELDDQLEKLLNAKPDYSNCHVKSEIIYGITEIELGYSKLIIRDVSSMCNVYYKDGELILGTF